jgi:hypothetical protein
LEPTVELVVWPTQTGTVVGSPSYDAAAYSTITAAAASFYPSMVGRSFTFDTSEVEYTIYSYTSATEIVVVGDASGEAAADTFTVTATGDYRMPDDFASINGLFYIIDQNIPRRKINRYNVGQILEKRTFFNEYSYTPDMFAIAPEPMTGASGQRQKVMLYPTPNTTITLTYTYSILPDALTASLPYPRGTEVYSEAIRYAALAEVEKRIGSARGFKEDYQRELLNAIARDELDSMPDSLGYNGDPGVYKNGYPRGQYYDRTVGASITYNGQPV